MNKINWKLRLQNKATLVALIAIVITVTYQVLGWFGVTPSVSQGALSNVIELVIKALMLLGIVVDPTTAGVSDSTQAISYEKPSGGTTEAELVNAMPSEAVTDQETNK